MADAERCRQIAKRWAPAARAKEHCAELGLPNLLVRWTATHQKAALKMRGVQRWQKLARDLAQIEEALTAWEAANPAEYAALPWYEDREAYKAAKARGEVEPLTWWMLAGACNEAGLMLKRGLRPVKVAKPSAWRARSNR